MARPYKQTVDYFPHDANACMGDTLTVLQSQFGNDGYAFWFKLLEKLASTEGHFIDCRNSNRWQLLLAKTGVNELLGVEIMLLLVEMKAIDKELWNSKLIWCQKLVDNIADVYKNRRGKVPSKPVITDDNPITTDNNPITTDKSTQTKLKKTKLKKTKENEDLGPKGTPDSFYENRKIVFEELKIRRGYESPVPGKEAKAITWMLKQGYSVEQIMGCFDKMKLDSFWMGKMLDMVNVQKQIGELVNGTVGGATEADSKWAGWEKLAGEGED